VASEFGGYPDRSSHDSRIARGDWQARLRSALADPRAHRTARWHACCVATRT